MDQPPSSTGEKPGTNQAGDFNANEQKLQTARENVDDARGALEDAREREIRASDASELAAAQRDVAARERDLAIAQKAEREAGIAKQSADPRRALRDAEGEAKRTATRAEEARVRALNDQQAAEQAAQVQKEAEQAQAAAKLRGDAEAQKTADALAADAQKEAKAKAAIAEYREQQVAEAEAKRIAAIEKQREAADRMRDHLQYEAERKELIDAKIKMELGTDGPNAKSGMRVVADTQELNAQMEKIQKANKDWRPVVEQDPSRPFDNKVQGYNMSDTNASVASSEFLTQVHERIHANTSDNWNAEFIKNNTLNEGMTEHLANKMAKDMAGPGWEPPSQAYLPERQVAAQLDEMMPTQMREAFGKGKVNELLNEVGERMGATGSDAQKLGRETMTKIDELVQKQQNSASSPAEVAQAKAEVADILSKLRR